MDDHSNNAHRGNPAVNDEVSIGAKDSYADLERRLEDLRTEGILVRATGPNCTLRMVTRVPGALARFLEAQD